MNTTTTKPLATFRRLNSQQQGYAEDHNVSANLRGARPLNPVENCLLPKRTEVVKVRLTEDELKILKEPLTKDGKPKRGLSEEIRARLFRRKSKSAHNEDCEHCRLLATVVNALNIIARRCETLPDQAQAVEILVSLRSLEREISKAAK